jgi:hypothetical protein
MHYLRIGPRVYYSNAAESGVIENGISRSWGLTPPIRISATETAGMLRAGRYQFALTYMRSDGQESGSSLAGVLELSTTGGLNFSSLPVSTDSDVVAKVLYLTKVNGETLLRRAEIPNATTSFAVRDEGTSTLPIKTQHLNAPPAGRFLAVYNGRIVLATDRGIAYSEPYAYELFDRRAILPLEGSVTMVAPVKDGVFVGTDIATIYLEGDDLSRCVLVDKAAYGVIPGTLAYSQSSAFGDGSKDGNLAIWASDQGLCAGADDGTFRNLTQDRFAYPKQPYGAAFFRQHRGMNQYIAVLQGTETQGNIFV